MAITEFFPDTDLINALYFIVPIIAGSSFAAIGLYNKFPTSHKVAYKCWSGMIYLVFSSLGALLFTQIMLAMGTKVMNHAYLNCFIMGLLGAGLFLGIISRISIPQNIDNPVHSELITLSDYIYKALEDSIERYINESKQMEIQKLINEINSEILPSKVNDLINFINEKELDSDGKQELKIRCDKYYAIGDYNSMIRELTVYFSIQHISKYLSLHQDKNQARENS